MWSSPDDVLLPEGYGWDDHRKDEGAEIPGGCWSSLKRNQGILSENLKETMLLQLKKWCFRLRLSLPIHWQGLVTLNARLTGTLKYRLWCGKVWKSPMIGIPWIFLYGSDDVTPRPPIIIFWSLLKCTMVRWLIQVPPVYFNGDIFCLPHSSSSFFLQNPVGKSCGWNLMVLIGSW